MHAQVLNNVKEYAKAFNAVVEALYIGEKLKTLKTTEQIQEALDGMQYYFKNIPSNSVIRAVVDECIDLNADILIMTPHKYGFWSSLIHRSKPRAMA